MEGKNNKKNINKNNFKIVEEKKDNRFSKNENSENKNNNKQKNVLNASINIDITLSDDIFKSIGLDDNDKKKYPIKRKVPKKPKQQNIQIAKIEDDNKSRRDAEYEKFINRKKIKR